MSKILLAAFLLLIPIHSISATPLPLEYFAKDVQFGNVKLSPDGKHFAATFPRKNSTSLAIIERESMRPVSDFDFGEGEHISNFDWVNNERVVFTRTYERQSNEADFSLGEIYAANIDGTRKGSIFGYGNRNRKIGARRNESDLYSGTIIHMLPDDPKHVLIEARSFRRDFDAPIKILKLNVYTGRRTPMAKTPFGNMNVVINAQGKPVIASGTDIDGNKRKFWYENGKWIEIADDNQLIDFEPIAVNKAGNILYLTTHPDNGTEALFKYDLKSSTMEKYFQHPENDFFTLVRTPETRTIVGVGVMAGAIEYHYPDDTNEFARLHQSLFQAFNGHDIRITSRTSDMSEIILYVMSDKNPGDFYVFNTKTNKASFLLSRKRWIEPQLMADRHPISFQARDGQSISGYLTMPLTADKDTPLVTYVHGGPYGVQDTWYFDTTAQMLANNGYAVLQVNYRGSGGFGLNFEESAYQKRSTLIQHDIIDGTKWAMSRANISDNKVCIMGWSFGGYSALMSPLIEPDLFKCSIAAAGVYDAYQQEKEADYADIRSVSHEAAKVYGTEKHLLKEESPLTYIDKLKIPVFIVHGGKDRRVPPEQAYFLKEALDKRQMPYEWMFKPKEGHGFNEPSNRAEFYQRALDFLDKYLR